MAESFSSITLEIRNPSTGVWTDIWADVLANPAPRGSRGILNNGLLDRVASAGWLSFSLDNSENNSQGTLGYYSTGATRISPANAVRLSFTYDGVKRVKFYGWPVPGSVIPTVGLKGPRRVDVTCRDFFGLADEYQLPLLEYATNKRIDEAVNLILEQVEAVRPTLLPDYRVFAQGQETFPDVFDLMKSETTIAAEFTKLTISEMGYLYEIGNDNEGRTLVIEDRLQRYNTSSTPVKKRDADTTSLFLLANGVDRLLLANGSDKLLIVETTALSFDESDIYISRDFVANPDEHYANIFKISITSRIVDTDATSILYTIESPVLVAAGESEQIRGTYRNPDIKIQTTNCIEGTPPVPGSDFVANQNEDGTGSDLTSSLLVSVDFGTAEASITLTNTGGTDLYTGGADILFQLRGRGVYVLDTVETIVERTAWDGYGKVSMDFPMVYFSGVDRVKTILNSVTLKDWELTQYKSIKFFPLLANRDVNNMLGFMYLEPGMLATFTATLLDYDTGAFINGYTFEIINDKKVVAWSPVLANSHLSV